MEYQEVINGLQEVLNTSRSKTTIKDFRHYIQVLKDDFEVLVSTKYLRNLINGQDDRQRTYKVRYLLRESGLKTQRGLRMFKKMIFDKYDTLVTNWSSDATQKVYNDECELSEEEKTQLQQLRTIKEHQEIDFLKELRNEPQDFQELDLISPMVDFGHYRDNQGEEHLSFNSRVHLRNEINKSGKPFIIGMQRDENGQEYTRKQKCLKYFVSHTQQEVLFFII